MLETTMTKEQKIKALVDRDTDNILSDYKQMSQFIEYVLMNGFVGYKDYSESDINDFYSDVFED